MIIFSCQNQIFENDIIFSCPWFRIRIKRWHKTTAQQHHLNFGLRCALHLSQHVWAEWIKHWNKIHFFNYEKLTKFFLCTRIPELSHTWTQTWWEWSQTWLSCRAPQRWSLPPQQLASHRSSPPAQEEQIKRVRLFYKKNHNIPEFTHLFHLEQWRKIQGILQLHHWLTTMNKSREILQVTLHCLVNLFLQIVFVHTVFRHVLWFHFGQRHYQNTK